MSNTAYTEEEFNNQLKEGIIILDFFANWCGPCKELSPILDKIESKYSKIKIMKINIENNNLITETYDIRSLPTLIFYYKGEIFHRETGFSKEGYNIAKYVSTLLVRDKYDNTENKDKLIIEKEIEDTTKEIFEYIKSS